MRGRLQPPRGYGQPGGACRPGGGGTRGHLRPSSLARIFRAAVTRKHPRMGILNLSSGGREGHHVGSMDRRIFGGGQMDGDVALVA